MDLGRERVAIEAKAGLTVAGDAWYERRDSDVRTGRACS